MSVFKRSLWFLLAGPLWLVVMLSNYSPRSSEYVLVAIVVFGISIVSYFSAVILMITYKRIKESLYDKSSVSRIAVVSLLIGPTILVTTILFCWRLPENEHEWFAALSSSVILSLLSFFIVHSYNWVLTGFVSKD